MLDLVSAYYLYSQNTDPSTTESFNGDTLSQLNSPIVWLVGILFGLWAGSLAWNCNRRLSVIPRLIISLLAFVFSGWYLLYYFVRYYLLNGRC